MSLLPSIVARLQVSGYRHQVFFLKPET